MSNSIKEMEKELMVQTKGISDLGKDLPSKYFN
jgi:hypothetical protein